MNDLLGFNWISDHVGIVPTQPFRVLSRMGSARKTVIEPGSAIETYPAQFRPEPSIKGHLTFALKYEALHLEFLSRLCDAIDPSILEGWVLSEPTGAFARRAGFFYEWLTGKVLNVPDVVAGNYVDVISSEKYLTSTKSVNNQRWRVRDNLPGTREFCPVVLRTESVKNFEQYSCAAALQDLEVEYGAELLMRSAVWLTIKESRASFAIEHEEDQADRIKRFAVAMERHCGKEADPLEMRSLAELQEAILGRATRYGLRRSPVFVGHVSGYAEIVDYVGPHWDHTQSLLDGLRQFLARTVGGNSIQRAAVVSFGFVYIHPMADGNGRISRFLINDILRRDNAVPAPFILPVSATITNSSKAHAGYHQSLEALSRPLMQRYKEAYKFGAEKTFEDGVSSNFDFNCYDDAVSTWRYIDMTSHVEYLGNLIQMTIYDEMRSETMYLHNVDRMREGVKRWLEGPNTDIDRIIRSISKDGSWRVSNKLAKEFPALADSAFAEKIIAEIKNVLLPAVETEDEANENK